MKAGFALSHSNKFDILGLAESAPLTAEEVAVTGKGQFSRGLQNLVRPTVQVILGNLKCADILASGLYDANAHVVDVVNVIKQLQRTCLLYTSDAADE